MQHVRWGIIGCGDVTEVKSGPAFQKAERSSLVAVMRRDAAKAEDYARRHGVPRWYADAAALVADPEVDAVYVATPPSSHHRYALLAARAGKPVYVEKPMALDPGECEAMIAACRDARVPLFTAYYRRAMPRFAAIKRLVDAGAIGTIRAATVSMFRGVVAALIGGHYAAEDVVSASFTFEGGAHGTGLWSFSASGDVDRTELVGTHGRITYATFGDAPVTVETAAGLQALTLPFPAHVQQPLIQTIVDELTGAGTCPSTAGNGARATQVMHRLLAAYYGK